MLVMFSAETKQALRRSGNALICVWLFTALFAYLGVVRLEGLLADLTMLTVAVVAVLMIYRAFRTQARSYITTKSGERVNELAVTIVSCILALILMLLIFAVASLFM